MKHFHLIVISLLIPILCSSQKVIKFDFTKKEFVKDRGIPAKISTGETYRVEVIGINQNIWKVEINNTDSNLKSALSLPNPSSVAFEALSSFVGKLGGTVMSSVTSENDNKMGIVKGLNQTVSLLKDTTDANDEIRKAKVIMFMAQEQLKNHNELVREYFVEVDKLKFDVGIAELSAYDLPESIRTPRDLISVHSSIINFRKKANDIHKVLSKDLKDYESKTKNLASKIEKDENLKGIDASIRAKFEQLLKQVIEIETMVNSEQATKLLKSLLVLNLESNYKSMPMVFSSDITELEIKFTPRDDDYHMQSFATKYQFPINRLAYWSIGLSYYTSRHQDERYSTVSTIEGQDTTETFSIVDERSTGNEIGINSMLRFGSKLGRTNHLQKLGAHGSIGVGVPINTEIKGRIMGGIGISYGKKHNVSLDYGISIGNVQKRREVYEENTGYRTNPENITNAQLEDRGFIALGYFYKF